MMNIVRIICVFLFVASTVFAQMDTLSDVDQYKAALRVKIWQETMNARLLARVDIAIGYLDIGDNVAIHESIRDEIGFEEEEHRRWINTKNVEFFQTLEEVLEPLGERLETIASLDEFDECLAEANRLLYDAAEKMQVQLLEEIGTERLQKLRKLGLQLSPVLAESGLLDFKAYEILDLTEEQRKQLEILRQQYVTGLDEIIKEKERLYEQAVDFELKWAEKSEEAIKENEALILEEAKKLQEQGTKAEEKFQGIVKSVRAKISLLLTPQQTERLEKIIAETPAWLKSTNQTEAAVEDDSWKDSWKPGDPVPEKQTKERKAFPLKVL